MVARLRTEERDLLDFAAAQLVLHGGHGATDFANQRAAAVGRSQDVQPAHAGGPHKDRAAIEDDRQIGLRRGQIDQHVHAGVGLRLLAEPMIGRGQRSQHQTLGRLAGRLADGLYLPQQLRADRRGQHIAGLVAGRVQGDIIQQPVFGQRVEFALGLEADHVRQLFVRSRRQRQLLQLDTRSAYCHQGVATTRGPPRRQGRGEFFGQFGIGIAGTSRLQRDRHGVLNRHALAARLSHHDPAFVEIPFQGENTCHRSMLLL